MARRRIGQEHLRLGDGEGRRSSSLDTLGGLIDWAEVDRHLASIYAAAKGEQAWPPLFGSGASCSPETSTGCCLRP
jgi:IS5 family transposase